MAINIDRKRFQNLGHLEFLARQVVEGFITGLHKSPFHGFSVEFAEHRLYNPGESTRHIDWKLYARTEKLFVKRYEEETNLRAQVLLDTSSSMFYPRNKDGKYADSKMEFSIYAAAALIELFRRQRDAVGLSTFAEKVNLHTDARSNLAHLKFLYNAMEEVMNDESLATQHRTSAVEAIHEVAERINRRSLVLIFSDMMDNSEQSEEMFNALQHLRYNKHEVVLFHVVDGLHELQFEFANRPYTFQDPETGDEVKVHPNAIKKHYTQSMEKFRKELEVRCGRFGIDYVLSDVRQGFNPVLSAYLMKRQKMY